MKWCFFPFGGEEKCRDSLIDSVDFPPNEKILGMCCGTGGATMTIAKKADCAIEIIGCQTGRHASFLFRYIY